MTTNVVMQVADLDDIRTTLGAVMQYLQAEDIAQSQRKLHTQTEYSMLTLEVVRIVNRVENVMKDYLINEHDNPPEAEERSINEQEDDALD